MPYFLVRPKDLKHDGSNPTLLYGYGGFEISMTPAYSGGVGKGWLEKGGVYAVANIRGGGEYGPRWHQAALKANRHKAYEDFAAVAQDLVARKITSPKHLGIQGGSNGGLLVGNMLTQYPELFGAVVVQVPLLDMQRYHKLLAGASWMAEYGDPDKPEEWEFIQTFSPYHLVEQGRDVSADDLHDLHARRPRASGPCPQDDGEDAGARPRRALLREHRRRPRRRGQQRAAGAHERAGLYVPVAAAVSSRLLRSLRPGCHSQATMPCSCTPPTHCDSPTGPHPCT